MILRGRYQILKKLSEGGFGVTFLAEDKETSRNPICVVKQLNLANPDISSPQKQKVIELFQTEAKVLSQLGHKNQIPMLIDYFCEDNEFYIVQEYIEGETLYDYMVKKGRLEDDEVIDLLESILFPLVYVHKHNKIHRDIKPQNLIRCRYSKKIYLIDFGIVKEVISRFGNKNKAATIIGTPGYRSYEQSTGISEYSNDIYSLGIVGIQLLTGLSVSALYNPPDSFNLIAWKKRIQNNVDPKLINVLNTMVEYHHEDRYFSAKEALKAVRTVKHKTVSAHQSTTSITLPPTTFSTNKPHQLIPSRKFPLFSIIVSVFAIAAFATVFFWMQSQRKSDQPIQETCGTFLQC